MKLNSIKIKLKLIIRFSMLIFIIIKKLILFKRFKFKLNFQKIFYFLVKKIFYLINFLKL
jgi:ABC-type multidrug transport system permease subunit